MRQRTATILPIPNLDQLPALLVRLGLILIAFVLSNVTTLAQGSSPQGFAGHIRWDNARGGNSTGGGPVLAGVSLELFAGLCAEVSGLAIATLVTGADGRYSFSDLQVGDYCLLVSAESLPEHAITTAGASFLDVTVVAGQFLQNIDLSFTRALAEDRLVINLQAPCDNTAWLGGVAAAHAGNLFANSPSGCSFIVQAAPQAIRGLQQALQVDPRVHDVGVDALTQLAFVPNDPSYNNPSQVYGPQQINASGAWDHTLGDENLIVAVLDTGIDLAHPEFVGRLLPGYDFVNEDSDPTDDNGHGTHAAGILAAGIDNGIGIAGMAGRAKILPVKVLDATGSGFMSDVSAGIIWAVDQGARVINLSLGGPAGTTSLENAIAYANAHGAVVVASAGNYNTDDPFYPASYTDVLGVGATQPNGERWTLSNFGPNVDVMAPGSMIYSTHWNATQGSRYAFMSGTSMAGPHAAGVAALVLSVVPSLTTQEVRDLLFDSATDLGDPGYDDLHGYGRVDAQAALEAAPVPVPPSVLGDTIWLDGNANGLQDVGEPGIGNVTLALYLDDGDSLFNPAQDDLLRSTVSGADGSYLFTGLQPGTYFVDISDDYASLAGFTITEGADPAGPILLASPGQYRQVDFGYRLVADPGNAILGTRVWYDGDSDGSKDPGEPAAVGIQVCADPLAGGQATCATTNLNGQYFIQVPAGNYSVAPTNPPAGWTASTLVPQVVTVVDGEERLDIGFGYADAGLLATPMGNPEGQVVMGTVSGSIGDQIWEDVTEDGIYDPVTEPGIAHVSVDLITDGNGNGAWDAGEPIIASMSDPSGHYLFTGVPHGTYLLRVSDALNVLQAYTSTLPAPYPGVDGNNQAQPYPVQLTGDADLTADFGYRRSAAGGAGAVGMIGDTAWVDGDEDGLYEPGLGESGLAGVTVNLYRDGQLLASTSTGPQGTYLFTELEAGNYTIQVDAGSLILGGYQPTVAGPNPGQDGNSQAQPYAIALAAGQVNLTADFGYRPLPPTQPGDCNGDSVLDAGDLSALVLEVFDGDGNDPASAGESTFQGDPLGCNANEDTVIDAGDFSCLVLLVFTGPGACSGPAAQQQAGPQSQPQSVGLSIPLQIPAQPGGTVRVPIIFDSSSASISSLLFSLDYDENWLSFDPTDSDQDGIPDAVSFHVPGVFNVGVTVDLADGDGELDFVVADFLAPLASIPNGVIATVTLNVGAPPRATQANVGFSADPPASFGDTGGLSVPGTTAGGSVRIDAGAGAGGSTHSLFLPLVS